ncbi:GNAT family N-acetyltransferase [Candidatus Nomurabacteria bacterium]|nr:GNAT family N-acetyltransferase [Candidatus Nomurabacteria bacterium]
MNIRKATTEDLGDLLALDAKLDAYRHSNYTAENKAFHDRINPHEPFNEDDLTKSIVLIARDNDSSPLGFIRGTVTNRASHVLSSLGYIDELFVDEDARGKGIAKSLFEMLESEFKKQGCDHMTTQTDAENDLSRSFYQKAGMSEVTVELWKKI